MQKYRHKFKITRDTGENTTIKPIRHIYYFITKLWRDYHLVDVRLWPLMASYFLEHTKCDRGNKMKSRYFFYKVSDKGPFIYDVHKEGRKVGRKFLASCADSCGWILGREGGRGF